MRHWDLTCGRKFTLGNHRTPLSPLMMEIDYLIRRSDVHGQNVANEILAEMGKLLLTLTRAGDSIYREGNGRFLFMLPPRMKKVCWFSQSACAGVLKVPPGRWSTACRPVLAV